MAKRGESGTIGILSSTKDATIQNAWIDAMKTYITASYPKLKVGPIGYGQSHQAASQTQASNLINFNPDLKALIPINGAAVPGALVADGTMPAAGGTFTAGDLGTFTVSDDTAQGTIIFSKLLEFTKDNYKQHDFRSTGTNRLQLVGTSNLLVRGHRGDGQSP